jgi:hypothetical protein
MSAPNKYTVHTRLAMLENAATEIRKEISAIQLKEGKPGVRGCDGARGLKGDPGRDGSNGKDGRDAVGVRGSDGIQGPIGIQGRSGRDGANGKDGKDGAPGRDGKDGRDGSVVYLGPAEVEAAVAAVRSELLTQRARFLGAIDQAIADNGGSSGVQRLVRAKLQAVKQEAGLV